VPDTDGRSPYVGLAPYDAASGILLRAGGRNQHRHIQPLRGASDCLIRRQWCWKEFPAAGRSDTRTAAETRAAVVLFRGWHQPISSKAAVGLRRCRAGNLRKRIRSAASEPLDELLARAG
jgi:hypothetical protein